MIDKKQRSEFMLRYRLIIPVKNGNDVITDEVAGYLRGTFERIGEKYAVKLLNFKHKENYIDAIFKTEPQTVLSKFINAYKTSSSRIVKKNYPEIKNKLYQNVFWENSYILLSEGSNLESEVRSYLKRKGVYGYEAN